MRFEKIWIEQCRATRAIKRRFGARSALDYLVSEKLRTFAAAARIDGAFARELPGSRPLGFPADKNIGHWKARADVIAGARPRPLTWRP